MTGMLHRLPLTLTCLVLLAIDAGIAMSLVPADQMEINMQMIDNAIILSLIVLAFVAGMKISDHYNKKVEHYRYYSNSGDFDGDKHK